jgi:hypothetical protein
MAKIKSPFFQKSLFSNHFKIDSDKLDKEGLI